MISLKNHSFRKTRAKALALLTGGLFLLYPAITSALTIKIDYRTDNGFLKNNPVARAAVERAAMDIGSLITTRLAQIEPASQMIRGNNGKTNAVFELTYFINDPMTGEMLKAFTPAVPEDTVVIYAGGHPLDPGVAGKGSSGGIRMAFSAQGYDTGIRAATREASIKGNQIFLRGGGPHIQTIIGRGNLGGVSADYKMQTGSNIGSLWFNTDPNKDRRNDTPEELNRFWHYDHMTQVSKGKIDLYTVALHEMMHALGIGNSDAWEKNRQGTTWNGSAARTVVGSPLDMVNGAHLNMRIRSRRVIDNQPQYPLMGPATSGGERKMLTHLDLALLKDIGWEVRQPPSGWGR